MEENELRRKEEWDRRQQAVLEWQRASSALALNVQNIRAIKQRYDEVQKQQYKPVMTGPFFYIMLTLAVVKDASDVVASLTVVFSILTVFSGLAIEIVIWLYIFFNTNFITGLWVRLLKLLIFSFFIELVPFISMLPVATTTLIMTRYIANNHGLQDFGKRHEKELKQLERMLAKAVA